jgi:hypothetical protein
VHSSASIVPLVCLLLPSAAFLRLGLTFFLTVRKGLILSVGPLPASSARLRPDGVPRQGWEEYSVLWKTLLGAMPDAQEYLQGWKRGIDESLVSSRESVHASLHKLFVESLMKLLSTPRLDISHNSPAFASEEATDAEAQEERPQNERDFELFLGLIELCTAVLPHACHWRLPTFCLPLLELVNELCLQHTDISGFYKLQNILLRACGDPNVFADISLRTILGVHFGEPPSSTVSNSSPGYFPQDRHERQS